MLTTTDHAAAAPIILDAIAHPTHFIVQTAAAPMPNSCWGEYRRVAVLEVDANKNCVSMISERARGVKRIVRTWEKCNVGTTERCAYDRAVKAARELAASLNAGGGQ